MFELPVSKGLIADDLREKFRDRQRELLRTNPAVRAAFALDDPTSAERRERQKRGLRRKAETASRAGVRLSQQARIEKTNKDRANRRLDQYDHRAQHHGYADLEHLLKATAHLTYAECAKLMGWTDKQVYPWRRRYGVSSEANPA